MHQDKFNKNLLFRHSFDLNLISEMCPQINYFSSKLVSPPDYYVIIAVANQYICFEH